MKRFEGRRVSPLAVACSAIALALPTASPATTFSFGTIGPGDSIASISLAPSSPQVSFSTATNEFVIEADVSTISLTSGTVLSIPLGTVTLSSQVQMLPGSLLFIPGFLPKSVVAEFANGVVADMTIADVAGSMVMLNADYVGNLSFFTTQNIFGIVTGSLDSDFSTTGGDADFQAAWGPGGSFNVQLSGYQTGGASVSSLCGLLLPNCFAPADLRDFTANPVITMIPIPEPGVALLLGGGVPLLAVFARKR